MEVLVYLVLGLSIWILVPSERSALVGRVAERSALGDGRHSSSDDAEDTQAGAAHESRDR